MTLKDGLRKIANVDGFLGVCVVDSDRCKILESEKGCSSIDLEVVAAGSSEMVRTTRRTMRGLGLKDDLEEISTTLGKQYHLIWPLSHKEELFLCLVLDRTHSNLALARILLSDIEKMIII